MDSSLPGPVLGGRASPSRERPRSWPLGPFSSWEREGGGGGPRPLPHHRPGAGEGREGSPPPPPRGGEAGERGRLLRPPRPVPRAGPPPARISGEAWVPLPSPLGAWGERGPGEGGGSSGPLFTGAEASPASRTVGRGGVRGGRVSAWAGAGGSWGGGLPGPSDRGPPALGRGGGEGLAGGEGDCGVTPLASGLGGTGRGGGGGAGARSTV